jgi:two-component system NtrC family sensor kinase
MMLDTVKVLLVEDNPPDALLIREMLDEARGVQYDLEHVELLAEGLERLGQGGVHAVLLDLGLPDSQGLDTFNRMYAAFPQVPLIVLSGLDDEDVAIEAARKGAQDYLPKGRLDSRLLGLSIRYGVERKKAEEALRASEEHYSALVGSLTDAVLQFRDGVVTWCNDKAEEIYGYPKDELVGRDIRFPYPLAGSPQEVNRRITAGIEKHGRFFETGKVKKKDGSTMDVEYTISRVPGRHPIELVAVARDVTERKQAEEEKAKMQQHLMLSGRLAAVGQLAAGVAHELNNPLAAVQGHAQLLASMQNLDEGIKSDVQTIYTQAQRACSITANLLAFAREHDFEKSPVSINEVIEKSLELNDHHLKVSNIEVKTELDPELPPTAADFYQLQQVFVNIIVNAEQAMGEANGQGTLTVKTQQVRNVIQASFTDTGPGIPTEDLSQIFDPFFTTRDVGKGTGLGLSICFGIVEQHGGAIRAETKLGEGTTFIVEIPIVSEVRKGTEQVGSIGAAGV